MTHIEELKEFENNLESRFNQLNQKKSEFDLAEQDILHYIEFERYDAVTGAKLLKKLKEVRIGRREIKNEFEELQSILTRFKTSGLHKLKRPEKSYTYRTITLQSVLGISETEEQGGDN